MLPISPSAEAAISSAGSTPSRPHRIAASFSPSSSRTVASRSPTTPMTTPVTSRSAGPIGVDGVGERAAPAPSGRRCRRAGPSIADSAVLAVPEPMLASSRSASIWRSVKCGAHGGVLSSVRRGRGRERARARPRRARRSRRSGRSGRRAARRRRRGRRARRPPAGSGRVTSSRWPTSLVTARARRASAVRTMTPWSASGVADAAQAGAAVDERQHAVAHDEHPLAGDGAQRVVGELDRALDAVDRHGERRAADLDEQRGHDRQRQRQPDLRGRALAELGVQQHLAAQLADRGAHRVHADAAAGDVARDLGGGEAGVEEQLGGRLRVDRVDRVGGDQPALGGLAGDLGAGRCRGRRRARR